jgi:O-antigen/teichoic acid export membrane protein
MFPKEAVNSLSWMLLNKVTVTIIAFLITVVIVRYLGNEKYGIYSLLSSFYGCLIIICSFGLNNSILRFIPELVQKKNGSNIRIFLFKVLLIQSFIGALLTILLYYTTPIWDKIFNQRLGILLPLTGAWSILFILRASIADSLIALFKVKQLAIVSFFQNLVWLLVLIVTLKEFAEVKVAICVNITVISFAMFFLFLFLLREIKSFDLDKSQNFIERSRIIKLALPDFVNQGLSTMLRQYTEIFFLGAYFPATIVGIYELGFFLPTMALAVIPHSTKNIFISAFSKVYVADKSSLGAMVSSAHKFLHSIVLPLSALGFFYSGQLIPLIYGDSMRDAGFVASFYSILGAISMISIPYAVAIVTKEKVANILPLTIMQIIVNIIADYLLIPKHGINGAIAAISITFIITYPVRLYVISRIIGGLFFPGLFILKIFILSYSIGYLFYLILPKMDYITMIPIILSYFSLYLISVKYLKIIKLVDIGALAETENKYIRKAIDLIVSKD